MSDMPKEYRTIEEVAGPLMLVKGVSDVSYNDLGEIELASGEVRRCKVLEINGEEALVQLFDSAAGICYDVDVSHPAGSKISIRSMSDGSSFSYEKTYKVAMTAYRANGGGELLTKGVGLSKEEIDSRTLCYSKHDIRHYMIEYISRMKNVTPQKMGHWRFVPVDWVEAAEKRERKILFPEREEKSSSSDEGTPTSSAPETSTSE